MLQIVGPITAEDAKLIDTTTQLYLVGVRARSLGKASQQHKPHT